MKKLLGNLMVLLIIVNLRAYSGGSGTETDPYHVANANDLKELMATSGDWGKFFIQMKDIDLDSQTANINPIGTNPNEGGTPFSGSYNGNGKTISNLKLIKEAENKVALFGYVDGGKLSNITLENVDIIGQDAVGSLVGWFQSGKISNSHTSGIVAGKAYIGGFVGDAENGMIENSSTSVAATGDISIGGFIGWLQDCQINSSYATGSVTTESGAIGGFVGYSGGPGALIKNSYATGNVTGFNYVGGLVGNVEAGTIENSYAIGTVIGSGAVGGLVGITTYGNFTSCYWDIETTGQSASAGGSGKSTAEMKQEATYLGWDFTNIWCFNETINDGYPIFTWQNTTGITENNLPKSLALHQNYPNPFNPSTTISYSLANKENVVLAVYNLKGELVQQLVNGIQNSGNYQIKFDASNLNSGVYYYRLQTARDVVTKKMILIK